MKKYIFIPRGLTKELATLTRNQILLFLFYLKNEEANEKAIKLIYNNRKERWLKDAHVIDAKYKSLILFVRSMQGKRIEKTGDFFKDKEAKQKYALGLMKYFKMKTETYDKIVEDNNILKHELLIILYILEDYQDTFNRTHIYNFKSFRESIFKDISGVKEDYLNKKIYNTLNTIKDWKYEDGSVLLKEYELKNRNIILTYDKKGKG